MLQGILIPFFSEIWFLTIDPFTRISVSSQSFLSDNTAGVFSRTFIVKNFSNSLTYTIASSCVCTSPLAVMTIVGLHDFVKVSISASLKSFLLIICIDAPESTTNSRSPGLRFDAGKHQFSEGEKMLLFLAPLSLIHFWPASTLLHGHLALATLSPPETDPQILERCGYAHEVHLGKKIRAKDFVLEFECDAQSLREFYALDWFLHVRALPENRLRRLHVLKDTTQMSCVRWSTSSRSSFQLMIGSTVLIRSPRSFVTFVKVGKRLPCIFVPIILLQHGHCTLGIILFVPFTRLFINLTMWIRALLSKFATNLCLVEQAFWRVPLFTEWVIASSYEVILARPSVHSTTGTFSSERIRRRIRLCHFSTLIDIVAETTIFPFTHCPLVSHCQQSPWILCTRCNVHWFVTTAFLSYNFHSWRHISYFVFPARYFFSPSFSICDNQVPLSSDESPGHTIPIRSWVFQTLVFSNL